jgi:hypothetical protein
VNSSMDQKRQWRRSASILNDEYKMQAVSRQCTVLSSLASYLDDAWYLKLVKSEMTKSLPLATDSWAWEV